MDRVFIYWDNSNMFHEARRWAEANCTFVALDDFYDSITFMTPSRPGFKLAPEREASELDLSVRRVS